MINSLFISTKCLRRPKRNTKHNVLPCSVPLRKWTCNLLKKSVMLNWNRGRTGRSRRLTRWNTPWQTILWQKTRLLWHRCSQHTVLSLIISRDSMRSNRLSSFMNVINKSSSKNFSRSRGRKKNTYGLCSKSTWDVCKSSMTVTLSASREVWLRLRRILTLFSVKNTDKSGRTPTVRNSEQDAILHRWTPAVIINRALIMRYKHLHTLHL